MTRAEEYHNKAMLKADLADESERKGERRKAYTLFREATLWEAMAVAQAKKDNIGEPSISILSESFASLKAEEKRLQK
jgi:hypothetical protein